MPLIGCNDRRLLTRDEYGDVIEAGTGVHARDRLDRNAEKSCSRPISSSSARRCRCRCFCCWIRGGAEAFLSGGIREKRSGPRCIFRESLVKWKSITSTLNHLNWFRHGPKARSRSRMRAGPRALSRSHLGGFSRCAALSVIRE